MDPRAREGEDEECAIGEAPEREVDEANGEHVAPVKILEDEDYGRALAFGRDEVEPGLLHLIAHELRVLPRGAEALARRVAARGGARAGVEGARRRADDLAQELGDAAGLRLVRDAAGDALAEARDGDLLRVAVADAGDLAQYVGEEAERRRGPDRVPATHPRLATPDRTAQKLVANARFSDAGGPGHEHGARDPLLDALVEEIRE